MGSRALCSVLYAAHHRSPLAAHRPRPRTLPHHRSPLIVITAHHLSSFLPKPKHATASAPAAAPASTATLASTALAARTGVALASAKPSTGAAPSASAHSTALVTSGPPPYRHRAGWVPRTLLDFADGGAFPEIHLAQYPLDLGRKDRDATRLAGKTLALRVDESGEIVYDALAKHGHARSQHVHATIADLVPMDRSADDDAVFARPDEEEVERTAERTRAALSKIVGGKLDASKVSSLAVAQPGKPQYIRYTPDAVGGSAASSGQTKVIRIVEAQIDPIEPPRFAHKKVPKGRSEDERRGCVRIIMSLIRICTAHHMASYDRPRFSAGAGDALAAAKGFQGGAA